MIAPRRPVIAGAVLLVGGLLSLAFATAASTHGRRATTPTPLTAAAIHDAAAAKADSTDPLTRDIERLQAVARANPADFASLAQLGLEYVQQAKITVNPSYYPKAKGVLDASLAVNRTSNFQAMAGQAALSAALHDFIGARAWAQRGLAIDPYNPTLYGSLSDADTQLGNYQQANADVQKMLNLDPAVPALTRAEYVYELQGQTAQAHALLDRSLAIANNPSDEAFVHETASSLYFNAGNPRAALHEAQRGLALDPTYLSVLEPQAKAEAALGMTAAAVRDFDRLVSAVPQPQYLVEYGEYLDSMGQHAQAQRQYDLFAIEGRLFTANGVTLDTDPTLFYADHGQPALALQYGQQGIRIRPFIEMQDAYGWALHVNGKNTEALMYVQSALKLGTRNALFLYHEGMIQKDLGQSSAALTSLHAALNLNPFFSPLDAPLARTAIAQLTKGR